MDKPSKTTALSNITVRAAEHADCNELSALARKTYAETFADCFAADELEDILNRTRSAATFEKYVASPNDTILLAFDAGRLAGYIHISPLKVDLNDTDFPPQPNDQAINALYIHSDFQRRGLGRKLMDEAFAHHCTAKADHIYIDVWGENVPAVSFYTAYGFEEIGTCNVKSNGKIVGQDLVLRCAKAPKDLIP